MVFLFLLIGSIIFFLLYRKKLNIKDLSLLLIINILLFYLMKSHKKILPEAVISLRNNDIIVKNIPETFITGQSDGSTIDRCDSNKDWIIKYNKDTLKNICPMYHSCVKRGDKIICKGNGREFVIDEWNKEIEKCTQKLDMLNFVQNEWKQFCRKNKKNCICIDINKKEDKKIMIENIQEWVENLNTNQLQAWKVFLIDKLQLRLKLKKYITRKSHSHDTISELIEHLKLLDKETYGIVKISIGSNNDAIKKTYEKILNIRQKYLDDNKEETSDFFIRTNLTIQILESIIDNYTELMFDKNDRFLRQDKCKEIIGKPSIGFKKDNLYSMSKISGGCPKNYYLKGLRYERAWDINNEEIREISTCCPTKKEEICITEKGDFSNKLDKNNLQDLEKIKGACPKYHYLKKVNYKEDVVPFQENDIVSLINSSDKYIYLNPMVWIPNYEKICKLHKEWKLDKQRHKRCYTTGWGWFRKRRCYTYMHPHWQMVTKEKCKDILKGEKTTEDSGHVLPKHSIFIESYVNDDLKNFQRDPVPNEKLLIIKQGDKYAFKTIKNYYLTADPNTKPENAESKMKNKFISAHVNTIGKKQLFQIDDLGGNKYAIKCFDGTYISSSEKGRLTFGSTKVSSKEIFTIYKKDKEIQQQRTCCHAIRNEQCKKIYGSSSQGLNKKNMLTLDRVDGECPKNHYLKGIEYEKDPNDETQMRQVLTCCKTDIRENRNITWEELLKNDTLGEYKPEPIESEVKELLKKKIKNKFCHHHHYIPEDDKDKLHFNLKGENCSFINKYPSDMSKNKNNNHNELEIYVQRHKQWLSDNTFLTKGQKLLFYLILLRIKNIDAKLDYNKLSLLLTNKSVLLNEKKTNLFKY